MSKAKEQLIDTLRSLGESSRYCTSGSVDPVLPSLEVKGVGEIGLPVAARDARKLIRCAARAPYGRGERTIVDPDVRRVWQLEPKQLTLANPGWNALISDLVAKVKDEFGIPGRVVGRLYKLLIYDKGSFFVPHRDTEKEAGMFGTLVVNLPSKHEGGRLVVSHGGESTAIQFGEKSRKFQIEYAAFYADCQHEVEPVISGFRVCMVYNLSIPRVKRQPEPPPYNQQVESIAAAFRRLFDNEALDKIAIPLQHEYTESGLSRILLKGKDRSWVDVVARSAEKLDCHVYLALMTLYQQGDLDVDSLDFEGYGRWANPDYECANIDEVFDESRTLDCWVDIKGRRKTFGELKINEEEILFGPNLDLTPVKREVHEATGNEGVTLEHWYRQAMIVIWPHGRFQNILASEGQHAAVPALLESISRVKASSKNKEFRQFAETIIDHWVPSTHSNADSKSTDMLRCLAKLGNLRVARRFIREVLPQDLDGRQGKALRQLCDRVGWKSLAKDLRSLVSTQVPQERTVSLTGIISIFEDLCSPAERMSSERRSVCRTLAGDVEKLIKKWDAQPEKKGRWEKSETREGIPQALFNAFCSIRETRRLELLFAHCFASKNHYDLHTVWIPALIEINRSRDESSPGKKCYRLLLRHCLMELKALTATPVLSPTDWARRASIRCRCADCAELRRFLLDPKEQVHRFRIRKDRRRHLHEQIDHHRSDIDHVTARRGSPQTLVCTKNCASYERKLEQFETDTRLLARIKGFAESG